MPVLIIHRSTFQAAKAAARALRKNQTHAEELLWNVFRGRNFHGLKFLRQHPLFFSHVNKVHFYIADFYCHEKRLVVELDGPSHLSREECDAFRTEMMMTRTIDLIRFQNEEVLRGIDAVLRAIEERLVR